MPRVLAVTDTFGACVPVGTCPTYICSILACGPITDQQLHLPLSAKMSAVKMFVMNTKNLPVTAYRDSGNFSASQ